MNIERKTHEIDATGTPVGRLATRIATLLRGKNKATFVPNQDHGDAVVVINADKMVFTGNKMEDKEYHRFTGYPGGLITTKAKDLWAKKGPAAVLRHAVEYMLPKNKLQKGMMKRLTVK